MFFGCFVVLFWFVSVEVSDECLSAGWKQRLGVFASIMNPFHELFFGFTGINCLFPLIQNHLDGPC